jgi:hypothetical protein
VPDGQWNSNSIWNRAPGPASPSMLNTNGLGNDLRRSPMSGTKPRMSGHVRGDSANSLLSVETGTPIATRAPSGIGSGAAWGTHVGSPSNWGSTYGSDFNSNHQYGYANGANMASPLLFSSYRDGAESSWGRTPPNGQGG